MATVILSEPGNYLCESPGFLSQSGNYTNAFLCANRPVKPQILSGGFFEEFFDDLGDLGNSFMDLFGNIVDATGNIVQGAGTGAGAWLSDPNNIQQIAGWAATGFSAMPPGLNQTQQQAFNLEKMRYEQMMQNQNQNSFSRLLDDPLLLIAGGALIYLIAKK